MNLSRLNYIAILLLSGVAFTAFADDEENQRLLQLYREDQALRFQEEIKDPVSSTDIERRELVFGMLAGNEILSAIDKFRAAIILLHTDAEICGVLRPNEYCSVSPENLLLANKLAVSSFQGGHLEARKLIAQTVDRYTYAVYGYQKYGTMIVFNKGSDGPMLPYIDRQTSDEERQKYDVAPLQENLAKFEELPPPALLN